MEEKISAGLSSALLDDFYAECQEHLDAIRKAFVAFEPTLGGDQPTMFIQALFRHFHSLKGILGMAGIRNAEQLAHWTEGYLRAVSRDALPLTPQGLDLIAQAVQSLEQIVIAFREQTSAPEVAPLLAQIASLAPNEPVAKQSPASNQTQPTNERGQENIMAAQKRGLAIWKGTFVPTPALNAGGINVNEIRVRLARLGDILHAAPQVQPNGGVAFEFFMGLHSAPADLAEWNKNGVVFELIHQASEPQPERATIPQAADQAAAIPSTSNLFVAPSHVVRVELNKLDELMRITGTLVIQRARLEEEINRIASGHADVDGRGFQEVNVGLARQLRELRELVIRLRMVPVAEIFDRMPFVVRDLARGTRKAVQVTTAGEHTELDKYLVERLKDPLLHLVRNSVSHGIEEAEERVAKGKSPQANLTLSAKTAGETVIIEVSDDGRGIDVRKVAQRAQEAGLNVPAKLDEAALLQLICSPGFSTRDEADRTAGRGVGMTVVSNTLRELGGSLSLTTRVDHGTRFILRFPLTLLITDALIVSAGEQRFAIPQNTVEEVFEMEENRVKRTERAELLSLRGKVLPIRRLRNLFGFPPSAKPHFPVLISHTERGQTGLVVDLIVGQRQIVVRSIRDPFLHVPGIVGATELGDGKPLLILDLTLLAEAGKSSRWGGAQPVFNTFTEHL